MLQNKLPTNMALDKAKFSIKLIIGVYISFLLTNYIFRPSSNQCQMTFMMEPPKFITIPIDLSTNEVMTKNTALNSYSDKDYKLFMYNELGFPQLLDSSHDLRDSVPVLFIPGNAGSYQQVRSLASTCIRFQLQSLEAHKFVFYTIDFRGQLSGIDGSLIESQIDFVHRSLMQIRKMHPPENGGVILVGHSIGGFITKALFTLEDFAPSSVSILLSFSSPLKKPYLNFDDKMLKLYERTKEIWDRKSTDFNETIAISISGGRLDRLVPMHLSMDPQYDLSLTTSSIKDVWLMADHVCITWCRELMNKLASLLSAITDKKLSRLVDKDKAMSIINRELISSEGNTQVLQNMKSKIYVLTKPYQLIVFRQPISLTREEITKPILVIELNRNAPINEIFIYIDHMRSLKEAAIYSCLSLDKSDNINSKCHGKLDLKSLVTSVPSRRFEPKKSYLRVDSNLSESINYIVLDFASSRKYSSRSDLHVPEFISVQAIDNQFEQELYIPALLEYVYNSLLMSNKYTYPVVSLNDQELTIARYNLVNLNHRTQVFTVNYISRCTTKTDPSDATILLSKDGHLIESFHSSENQMGNQQVLVKIQPEESNVNNSSKYLDFYIDGTCSNTIQLEIDTFDLFSSIIQRNLDEILTCVTYFAYASVVSDTEKLYDSIKQGKAESCLRSLLMSISGFTVLYFLPNYPSFEALTKNSESFDKLTSLLLIYIISIGFLASLENLVRRLLDLSKILQNLHLYCRTKLSKQKAYKNGITNSKNVKFQADCSDSISDRVTNNIDLEWIAIGVLVASSLAFSPILISFAQYFLLIKTGLFVTSLDCKRRSNNLHLDKRQLGLLVSIGVICSVAMLSNIPMTVLKIKGKRKNLFQLLQPSLQFDRSTLAFVSSLPIMKLICDRLKSKCLMSRNFRLKTSRFYATVLAIFFQIAVLTSAFYIRTDIRIINVVLSITLLRTEIYFIGHII